MLDTSQYPAHCELGKLRTDVLPNLKLNGTAKQIVMNSLLYEAQQISEVPILLEEHQGNAMRMGFTRTYMHTFNLLVTEPVVALVTDNTEAKINTALQKYSYDNPSLFGCDTKHNHIMKLMYFQEPAHAENNYH